MNKLTTVIAIGLFLSALSLATAKRSLQRMKFVILNHFPPKLDGDSDARTMKQHFDFMFEVADGDALKTFAAERLPKDIADVVEVTALDDHQLSYLDYEGPISNNRGTVERFAHGTWTGELPEAVQLSFDGASKHFARQSWSVGFRAEDDQQLKLFRLA